MAPCYRSQLIDGAHVSRQRLSTAGRGHSTLADVDHTAFLSVGRAAKCGCGCTAVLSVDTHMQVLICLPRGSRYGRIKERNHWTLKHVAGERILRADPPARDSAEKGTGLGHCQSHTQFLLLYSIPEFPNIFCQMSPGLSRIKTCK